MSRLLWREAGELVKIVLILSLLACVALTPFVLLGILIWKVIL